MAILRDNQVRMAHMAIIAGFSVNGVARLHTEILKNQELKDFYDMMPEKFNNKTNGITQRRFLLHGNPLLADWITERIGDGWITDLSLIGNLKPLVNDEQRKKRIYADQVSEQSTPWQNISKKHNGIDVDPTSIFDVQVKTSSRIQASAAEYSAHYVSVQSDQGASGDVILSKDIYLWSKGRGRLSQSQRDNQADQLRSGCGEQ